MCMIIVTYVLFVLLLTLSSIVTVIYCHTEAYEESKYWVGGGGGGGGAEGTLVL